MSGRDHETDINGECMPNCTECMVNSLKESRMRMFEECVRRGIAIEDHRLAMKDEGIRPYEFDRTLHAIVGIIENPKTWTQP